MAEAPWLSVVGIGEDGLDGIGARARALIEAAEVLVGGERHLGKVAPAAAERLTWADGIGAGIDAIADRTGKRVCVIASGDPLCFGVGRKLIARFGIDAMTIVPAPGAFALLAARMGWSHSDGTVRSVSCHAFPVEVLNRHLAPGLRLLILSRDGATPREAADLMCERGFGPSEMTVYEHMGGTGERRIAATAGTWAEDRVADLNVVAIHCRPGPDAVYWPETPGLPEAAFRHDGKITKREVRAATLARLGPMPGEVLWDVGSGSGAVAIEWLRTGGDTRAVAFEGDPARWDDIEANARGLGVPHLALVKGTVPDALADAPWPPDAVFAGGGIAQDGVLAAGWDALRPGGRLVANAVTVEAQDVLMRFAGEVDGELVRLSVARSGAVGRMTALRPLMDVLQLVAVKK